MYKMSNEAKELTQIRQITVEKYSKNKWISISDLQKNLDLQNLFNLATKKIKRYCNTKHPTKDQIRRYKRKVNQ